MDAFVKGKIARLTLASGDTIDVKDRLNARETEDLHAAWQPLIKPGQRVEMDTRSVRFAKVQAYLLGWSFTEEGVPVPFSVDAIDNLTAEMFTEIHRAIEAHETARAAEIEARTKNPAGSPESRATSPSVEP